jgi:hypothetical protein
MSEYTKRIAREYRPIKKQAKYQSDSTVCHANLGVEILALLRSKADAAWEYYNPHFLLAITEQIEAYYEVEDDVVDQWVQEMFSS